MFTLHLTDQQFYQFRQRTLPPAELLEFDQHLAQCKACLEKLSLPVNVTETVQWLQQEFNVTDVEEDDCVWLSYERKLAWLAGELPATELEWLNNHLQYCLDCPAELAEFRALHSSLPRHPNEPAVVPHRIVEKRRWFPARLTQPAWQWASVCLLLLAVAATVWYFWWPRTAPPSLLANDSSPSPTATATVMASSSPALPNNPPNELVLQDGENTIRLNAAGKLLGLSGLTEAEERLVVAALISQRVTLSAKAAKLQAQSLTLMDGTENAESFALLSPLGKVIRTARPQFQWRKLAGASNYLVTIFDEQHEIVATSDSLTANTWTPAADLPRGKINLWQVRANREGQEVLSPAPQYSDAKFIVLGQSEAAALTRAEQQQAKSHLVLGVLYANAGLLEEARRELQQLRTANPQIELAQKLWRSVSPR